MHPKKWKQWLMVIFNLRGRDLDPDLDPDLDLDHLETKTENNKTLKSTTIICTITRTISHPDRMSR